MNQKPLNPRKRETLHLANTPLSPPTIHVLIADSGLARLQRLTGGPRHRRLEAVQEFDRSTAHLRARDLTTDLPGRVFESSGRSGTNATHTRHSIGGDYDPQQVEIERFVHRIVSRLEELHRSGEISALALVAEPRMLGRLRVALPDDLSRIVTREVAGDHVHSSPHHILSVLDRLA